MRAQRKKYLISMQDMTKINQHEIDLIQELAHIDNFKLSSIPDITTKRYVTKKVKIVITIDDSFTEDDFDFDEKEILFSNAKDPQILIIDTSELVGIGIFDRMSITIPDGRNHPKLSEIHADVGSTSPQSYQLNDLMPINASQLLLFFKIPRREAIFRFFLALRLSRKITVFNCDPQIGHDPD